MTSFIFTRMMCTTYTIYRTNSISSESMFSVITTSAVSKLQVASLGADTENIKPGANLFLGIASKPAHDPLVSPKPFTKQGQPISMFVFIETISRATTHFHFFQLCRNPESYHMRCFNPHCRVPFSYMQCLFTMFSLIPYDHIIFSITALDFALFIYAMSLYNSAQ